MSVFFKNKIRCRQAFVSVLTALLLPVAAFAQGSGDEQGLETGKLDLKQDSLALREALDGWWLKANESLDGRMSWYDDAKFGCFVHWGVYSVPGGEWKGREVSGYSEHLMRKEKIPADEYRRTLVETFNPVEFDAGEWIRHAKEAGMRYFIVTAKHHDGFAMFFSDAYPYDMRLTKFNRDPMRELADEARKQGVKFGFYYSHAFDWEHPDAPGNDWDYGNPGGDELLCGSNWWFSCPQFLPRAGKYVSEKSIPQILELIRAYQPDILWFDTPHKLPLYENIRILKAIREADADIVVNGRLARFGGGNLGDYRNTGDRAAFFYPVEGRWESIPTTNESYGYSRHDRSHKPVGHFVRLLATAVSKGGNILMNVGPTGSGRWDDADVRIFNGVGRWLETYGEAIYGNDATDLPDQTWGVTTRKGDVTYLHVYDWPENGGLTVGGLTSDIARAWVVSDKKREDIEHSRINGRDVVLRLAGNAPDTVNTVIALTLKNARPACPVRLLDPAGDNTLPAFDAVLSGGDGGFGFGFGFGFGDGKPNRNFVNGWKSNDQTLRWKFRLNEPAAYRLYVQYNTSSAEDRGAVSIEVDGRETGISYAPFTERQGTATLYAGEASLEKGEHQIALKGVEYQGGEYMRPIAVKLIHK
ncbi:MAG: alpha-L-fucosidase [Tannerella sp.]|nr:alpha-L-fucosidase [Tannerella sp.]